MEFKEFSNPEEIDYDINASLKEEDRNSTLNYRTKSSKNPVKEDFNELLCVLGFPEIHELEQYGITEKEYDNPTIDALKKLRNYASDIEQQSQKHKR